MLTVSFFFIFLINFYKFSINTIINYNNKTEKSKNKKIKYHFNKQQQKNRKKVKCKETVKIIIKSSYHRITQKIYINKNK